MDNNTRPTIIYLCQTPSSDYNGLSVPHQFPDDGARIKLLPITNQLQTASHKKTL